MILSEQKDNRNRQQKGANSYYLPIHSDKADKMWRKQTEHTRPNPQDKGTGMTL